MVLWQCNESGCHSVWLWLFYRIEYISVHLMPPFCNGIGCFLCLDLYKLDWIGLPYNPPQWLLLSSCCLAKKYTYEWPQGYMPGCLPNRLVSSLHRVHFTELSRNSVDSLRHWNFYHAAWRVSSVYIYWRTHLAIWFKIHSSLCLLQALQSIFNSRVWLYLFYRKLTFSSLK